VSTHLAPAPAPAASAPFIKRHPWIFFAVAGLVLLTLMRIVCGGRELGKLAPLGVVPDFSLVDQHGKAFGSADLKGSPYIASFFFTSCKKECPAIMQANARVLAGLQKAGVADKVHLVSFSVDPEYDTPEVLRDYALDYPIDGVTWRLLTGSRVTLQQIIVGKSDKAIDGEVLQSGFATAWGGRQATGGLVTIAHAARLVLVDGEGRIRHYFDANVTEDLDNLVLHAADLTKGGK